MRDAHDLVREWFHRLAELPPEEQLRQLAEAPLDDAVREELRELLALDLRAADDTLFGDGRVEGGGLVLATPEPEATALLGERIGRYQLVRVLGAGGMGTVYEAQQLEPVQRAVALKLIRLGMDSAAIVARFRREQQALALMDHEGIARVFDCGTSERGQPFFVMELVPGAPIDRFCDAERMALDDRLRLMQLVCAAVQHAHQKGVVHRDLKPGNVLVQRVDGQLQVKVIDFGLAKALGPDADADGTLFTVAGMVVGTPEYMAPEQADPSNPDIDTRADIYSLGVMLYELVCGELPYPAEQLRRISPSEIQRVLRETDPLRPSKRLSAVGAAPDEVAAARQLSVSALRRTLETDLDWVVLKALEKDRERRYDSPSALADDLQRFLSHEPVSAGPPSVAYRARKFVRRYRLRLAAAAAVLLTLLLGAVGTGVGFYRAEQRAAENQRLADANGALAVAEGEARARAQKNLDDFRLLAAVVELAEAKEQEAALYPAHPDRIDAMQSWLRDRAEPLVARLPALELTLRALREAAPPYSDAELADWRASQTLPPALEAAAAELATRRRAAEVRAGRAEPALQALPPRAATLPAVGLTMLALDVAHPDRPRYGQEGLALAAVRLALQRSDEGDPSAPRHSLLAAMSWACFFNGLDDEALQRSREAERIAPQQELSDYVGNTRKLQAAIAAWAGEQGELRVRELDEQLARHYEATMPEPRFADAGDRFLFRTLRRLIDDLQAFAGPRGEIEGVRARLLQAETIGVRSIDEHRQQWDEAIAAIRDEPRYRGLVIAPQVGLVPLGPDPQSGLWEFVHLPSGAAGREIPQRDASSGRLVPTVEMGIVFVLLPGGPFLIGAQGMNPAAAHFDPQARLNEVVTEGELAPFFLGKYEVTLGQWARLWDGEESRRRPSSGIVSSEREPVQSVDWMMCSRVMTHHGMLLPTEAQWEYGCRAGTTTPYSAGADVMSLAGHANVLDLDAVARFPQWGRGEPFHDGFIGPAPVGSFAGNAFGLHDMHGNVWEWCRDWYGPYVVGHWPGDCLLRTNGSGGQRSHRGGGYNSTAETLRSSSRGSEPPTVVNAFIGVRAARAIS